MATLRDKVRKVRCTDAGIKRIIQFGRIYIDADKAKLSDLDNELPSGAKVYLYDKYWECSLLDKEEL